MMNKVYAALLAIAATVPAACGKVSSDTKADDTAAAESETNADFHSYSTGDLKLDCALGFEQLKADAIAMQDMEMATENEDQIAYMTPDGVSFTFTKEAHFAHPMILRRDVVLGEGEVVANGADELSIDMAACGYGTKEGADRMMERFAILNERFILQHKVRLIEQE